MLILDCFFENPIFYWQVILIGRLCGNNFLILARRPELSGLRLYLKPQSMITSELKRSMNIFNIALLFFTTCSLSNRVAAQSSASAQCQGPASAQGSAQSQGSMPAQVPVPVHTNPWA